VNHESLKNPHARNLWSGVVFSVLVLAGLGFAAQPARPAKPAASVLAEDKGKLIITVNGQPVGSEDFSISHAGDHWVARGATQIQAAHGAGRVTGDLQLSDAGQPLRYVWSAEGQKTTSTTVFKGSTAAIVLDMGDGKPTSEQDFQFASPVVILDNNMYHQYEILARVYNWSAGGPQHFAVLIPQEQSPGTITVESTGPATIEGVRYEQLLVHADVQVTVYLDSAHRLMRLAVPEAKAEVRRQ
jgi:hypothetical protein